MEIRKLQKTGGASLSVTLPRKWVKTSNLQDKDTVQIVVEEDNTLLVQPTTAKKRLLYSSFSIDNLSDTMLTRELIAHYVSGVDEIIIVGTAISAIERTKIRNLCNSLLGFELLDESSEKIVLKNVFDPTKFSLPQIIEKMFYISKSMLEDAYKALVQQDQVLAHDVINRDEEIDKFQIAITRQLFACIRNTYEVEASGLTEIDLIFYQNIATQLERIADHTLKIARNVSTDISGTPVRISAALINTLANLLKEEMHMVDALNIEKAHEILNMSQELENQIYSKKTKKHKDSFAWDVLEDSLDRIKGYLMNIAEMTIDQAVLKKDAATF